MPLTEAQKNSIKQQVFYAMEPFPTLYIDRSIYGSEPLRLLRGVEYFFSKPLAFQRQLLIMVQERQVFTYTVGSENFTHQERCCSVYPFPKVWGTEYLTGEEFLDMLRGGTINQIPELYRCVVAGIFSREYAPSWAHWLSLGRKQQNPHQTTTGLFNYEKTERIVLEGDGWWSLQLFVVGTQSGGNITYGLLPQLWVDAIDALEPTGTTGALLQAKTPPPVYIFSLDTLPEFDKNTFVMVDLLAETPPATFQNLLATKVKLRGKTTVFNALYSQSDRQRVERRRTLANPTTETYRWDNSSYTWTREGEANTGREVIYETKNYLTLSEAMTILNNL
jgi:hypothetical protein